MPADDERVADVQYYLGKAYEVVRKVKGWRYLVHFHGWGARYDEWVYEKEILCDTEENRRKFAKHLASRKSQREEEQEGSQKRAAGAGADCKDGASVDEEKKRAAKKAKWEDAVAPEVKSGMSREEKKLQAELEQIKKLEALQGAESDGGGVSVSVGSSHVEAGQKVRDSGGSVCKGFCSLSQAMAARQGQGGGVGAKSVSGGSIGAKNSSPGSANVSSALVWPTTVYALRPGVNDSWNAFQVEQCSFVV